MLLLSGEGEPQEPGGAAYSLGLEDGGALWHCTPTAEALRVCTLPWADAGADTRDHRLHVIDSGILVDEERSSTVASYGTFL